MAVLAENPVVGASPTELEPPKIVVRNVSRVFQIRNSDGKGFQEFGALQQLNLEVRRQEFLAVVGPSGCGKSTFLDILAGLAHPSSGEVYIDEQRITGPALDRGIVMQGYALFPWRTVRANVEFGLEIKGVPKKERGAISSKFLDLVGLQGFADRYPYELSGGMKQRVAIARALAYNPEVLLMDEPFAAVDAQTRESLQEELLRIWEETRKTIVFVTHSIEEAVFLADRVAVMSAPPGTIKAMVEIKLPRPRRLGDIRTSPDFSWICHKVWQLLQNGDNDQAVPDHTGEQNVGAAIQPTTVI